MWSLRGHNCSHNVLLLLLDGKTTLFQCCALLVERLLIPLALLSTWIHTKERVKESSRRRRRRRRTAKIVHFLALNRLPIGHTICRLFCLVLVASPFFDSSSSSADQLLEFSLQPQQHKWSIDGERLKVAVAGHLLCIVYTKIAPMTDHSIPAISHWKCP